MEIKSDASHHCDGKKAGKSMKKIIDNIIIFIICAAISIFTCDSVMIVVTALSALTMTSITIYSENRNVWIGMLCVYVIICLFYPAFIIFMPLILYYSMWYKLYGAYVVLAVGLPYIDIFEQWVWLTIITVTMLSALLSYYSKHLSELENKLIVLRDTSRERDLLLQEKNKELIEKQDYEIYLATLKERNRIAREIHDNVGHMLTRSILQVGALKAIHKDEPLNGQLESVNETLNQAMTSIRKSVHNLHDDAVDLRGAIEEATKEVRENYKLTLDYDMSHHVARNVKYCFIATVKEAMSNIVKYSNGDKVTIMMREHPGFYQMSIEDNGTIKATNKPGIGLINMKERVENLGGTIHFKNENGFCIFITVKK